MCVEKCNQTRQGMSFKKNRRKGINIYQHGKSINTRLVHIKIKRQNSGFIRKNNRLNCYVQKVE